MRRPVPVRRWHLVLLPAVVAANWLGMTARHEAAHAAVVLAFGGEIADVHLWPPRAGTLSWITFRLPLDAPGFVVPLQAAVPTLVALALVAAGWWALARMRAGVARANVALTLVVFPCCELVATAIGYWYGGSDLAYVLGTASPALRWLVPGALVGLAVCAVGALSARRHADGPTRSDHGWIRSRLPSTP